ncbi:iron chelate uptake ABC transporter family permease subunit [Halomonas huangheensis]|uniref:iron chelate uptake ABC transporter family permease subunit n=1 Tax=Halomonas huangheensis TaxID=1178482 RepID=UPI003AABCE77
MRTTVSRAIPLAIVALMTLAATLTVGPLTFVGLLAPHMARVIGFARAQGQLLAAGCLGATIMVLADWIGRNLFMPFQLSAGMVAAVIGGSTTCGVQDTGLAEYGQVSDAQAPESHRVPLRADHQVRCCSHSRSILEYYSSKTPIFPSATSNRINRKKLEQQHSTSSSLVPVR